MDPDETLRIIRSLVGQIAADDNVKIKAAHADELAEHVEALDIWITNAGYLPRDWRDGPQCIKKVECKSLSHYGDCPKAESEGS